MFKTILFLIIIFLILLNSLSFLETSEDIESLNSNETKDLKVSYEKYRLSFKPLEDGRYEFLIETNPLDTNESFIKRNIKVEFEIYDSNNQLLSSNKGSKYDVYANSYNSGDTVEIGEGGGNTKEDIWYYKALRVNLYKNNKYFVKLFVPKKENNSDDLISDENVKGIYKRDENNNLVEISPDDLKLEVDTSIKVNRIGDISLKENEDGKASLSSWILRGLILLIILLIVVTKIKVKFSKKDTSNKFQICKNCGFENVKDANYCKNCGIKLK
mgnify:CR=1 FL=1